MQVHAALALLSRAPNLRVDMFSKKVPALSSRSEHASTYCEHIFMQVLVPC